MPTPLNRSGLTALKCHEERPVCRKVVPLAFFPRLVSM